jgi:hypothetical protein
VWLAAAGDHALTGLAIGRMLGIAGNGSVITGGHLHSTAAAVAAAAHLYITAAAHLHITAAAAAPGI